MKRLISICVLLLPLSFSMLLFAQQPDDAQAAPATQTGDNVDVVAQIQQLKADIERLNEEVNILSNEVKRLQATRTSSVTVPKPVPTSSASSPASPPATAASSATEEANPITVLLFRDGHRVETRNYAIIGESIWVYTEQQSKRYRVADLDVEGTKKVNSENGVLFQLPPAR